MNTAIQAKQEEVKQYRGVLERYRLKHGQGRWYDLGRRNLERLEKELQDLEKDELRTQE